MNLQFENTGAFNDTAIRFLIEQNVIQNTDVSSVKPSSLDLTIIRESLVEVPFCFQASIKKTIAETLKEFKARKLKDFILEPGRMYVAEVKEKIVLPKELGVYAYANPKSSTGRADLHVRLMADFVQEYDTIPVGFEGKLYIFIKPNSFRIRFDSDFSLNQIRFFNGDTRLHHESLKTLIDSNVIYSTKHERHLSYEEVCTDQKTALLTIDLRADEGKPAGFIARRHVFEPVIWNEKNDAHIFFEEITKAYTDTPLIFEKDRFYILSSREYCKVPEEYACEMITIDEKLGEFRSHYAGFLDPGWGANNEFGRPFTLEVRAFEDIAMYHGQPVARIRYEKMIAKAEAHYDTISSNYSDQMTARLGKMFMW